MPSSRFLTWTTVALTSCFLSAACSARSFVVPPMTAIFLPARPPSAFAPVLLRTSSPVVSTKIGLEKSTCSMRESVAVVDPHSMCASPLRTRSMRFCEVAATHFTARGWVLSCCSRLAATRLQSSTE